MEVEVQHNKINLSTYFRLPTPGISGVSPVKNFRCGNKPSSVIHIFTILLQRNPALRAKDPLITDNVACLCPKKANIGPVTSHNIMGLEEIVTKNAALASRTS